MRSQMSPSCTPPCSPALPRPCSSDLAPREQLAPKRRTPESALDRCALGDDDLAPQRPAKRSTPRAGASLLYRAESGKFVPHRIPSMENMARSESVFSTYFADARTLGSGSYGIVYNARYTLNDERYAVKLLSRRQGDCETENEVLRVSFLQDKPHPNCLAYYFAWSDKKFDEYGIVSEMCAVGSLKRVLGCSALTEEQVWDFFVDLLHGLAHIHKHGLRHFDIKPENLFVTKTKDHVLRIGDFGVACPVGSSHELGRGSAPYAAPEMVQEEWPLERVGTSADMYSAGVVLFEMVSDYDLAHGARVWQQPPPERDFAVLGWLCSELMAADPPRRPAAEHLLARPDIAARAGVRALAVQQTVLPLDPFPSPEEMFGVRYNQLAQHTPSVRVVRNLFE